MKWSRRWPEGEMEHHIRAHSWQWEPPTPCSVKYYREDQNVLSIWQFPVYCIKQVHCRYLKESMFGYRAGVTFQRVYQIPLSWHFHFPLHSVYFVSILLGGNTALRQKKGKQSLFDDLMVFYLLVYLLYFLEGMPYSLLVCHSLHCLPRDSRGHLAVTQAWEGKQK